MAKSLAKIVQHTLHLLGYHLFYMHTEGSVPPDWKLANVTPIFKKGSKGDPSNYLPFSLTSVCCKVMESIIRDNIVEHLTRYQLIRPSQHSFVNACSSL